MKKRKQKIKSIREMDTRGELTKEILKGLAIGGVVVASFALPNLLQVLTLFGVGNARERYEARRAIERLKKQKLINMYQKGGDLVMEITEEGKKRVLKYEIDEMRINRPKKWDGDWRIVAYDIPERNKKARKALTGKLKEMGLYPLQKSVFACPFGCRDEIDFISEFFNIRNFIHYFIVKEMDEKDERCLKRYYNLK